MFPKELADQLTNVSDDWYVLARLALWAGDIEQALEWLDWLLADRGYPLSRYPPNPEADVIGSAASRLRRQAVRLRNEIGRTLVTRGLPEDYRAQAEVIENENWYVRATLWCSEERRYSACVYLSDLTAERRFYQAIDGLAGEQKPGLESPGYGLPPAKRQGVLAEDVGDAVSDYSPTIILEGNPFIEARPGDFGTMDVELVWTQRQLPKQKSEILDPLRALLQNFSYPQ